MYKNQLQELAQRSCFNLPAYTCIREGPDHTPRFKVTVNFNGELFHSPGFYLTLRQAEHAAAEVALQALAPRGSPNSLAARRILDETGVYKNLLQEISQQVGAPLPLYTTVRSGRGHLPVFTCTVELAGIEFTGEPAKNKKQAEKNAAMAAWFSLKQLAKEAANTSSEPDKNDEQEQITIARALLNYRLKEVAMVNNPLATPFPKKFPVQPQKKPSLTQQAPSTRSKILPLIQPSSVTKMRPSSPVTNDRGSLLPNFLQPENRGSRPHKFPAAGAAPYVPVHNFSMPYCGMAPPVTIRTAVPCFSSLPRPNQPGHQLSPVMNLPVRMASPVRIRPAVPVFAAPTPKPAMVPVIPGQPKEQPHFAVKYQLPDAVLPVVKSCVPSTVAVASSDPPVTPAHLQIQPAHIAVALRDPLLMLGQGKEQPPVAVELPPDVVLPDSPFKPVLLRGSSTVVASAEAMQRVQTEEVTDSAENDLLEIGALECFKRLEI